LDEGALIEAGLHSREMLYQVLQVADVGWLEPGRYRLIVDLMEDRPQLQGLQAELIVGYQSLGK
jgi:hypothetical protein